MSYGMSVDDLVKSLGFAGTKTSQMDLRAPGALIKAVSECTGKSAQAVRTTTFAGVFPRRLLRKSRIAGES